MCQLFRWWSHIEIQILMARFLQLSNKKRKEVLDGSIPLTWAFLVCSSIRTISATTRGSSGTNMIDRPGTNVKVRVWSTAYRPASVMSQLPWSRHIRWFHFRFSGSWTLELIGIIQTVKILSSPKKSSLRGHCGLNSSLAFMPDSSATSWGYPVVVVV